MQSRREVLTGAAGAVALAVLPAPAAASNGMAEAVRKLAGDAAITPGRVTLDIPPIAENGFSVPTAITVDSPMTADDHVRAIHIFSEQNPLPVVATFHLGPRAGRAGVATNIRLAASQSVTAIAVMSDGTLWSDAKSVVVTITACIDGGL